jgi:glycosyltransferase involved in cell wall biosynthesis
MISVVMAAYNRADTLQRAIDSVLAQTIDDWELIVVDDGSVDGTSEILARQTDPRIRVFTHAVNRGQYPAKNTGYDNIRGEWFTHLDSDDELTPDALGSVLDCAERTGATAVMSNCVDAVSGQLTGFGPTSDGWLSPEEHTRCRGEHWGITRTSLLGDMRLDCRLPGYALGILWVKMDAHARRYYLHRALRVYHTEGTDRTSQAHRSLVQLAAMFTAIGEDHVYLGVLRELNPGKYRHIMRRVRVGRILHPVLRRLSQ